MPKQPIVFDKFEKGENTASDPRDLQQGYVAGCVNMMTDEVGIVRTIGAPTAHGAQSATNQPTVTISAGRGLYAFSHDRLEGEVAGTGALETSDDYIAIADTGTPADIQIYSNDNDIWGTSAVVDLGTTTGMMPTFHTFDGGLRVSDGNFGANNRTKWYGYVDREKFITTTSGTPTYTDDGWFSLNNDLTKPIVGTFGENTTFAPTVAATAGKVYLSMVTATDATKPEAEWQKDWEAGISYVYDGTQETLVSVCGSSVDKSASTDLSTARFQLQIYGAAADRINERLTHVKGYIREAGSQEWFIQGVWDLQEGGRLINGDVNDLWVAVTGTGNSFTSYNNANAQVIPQILHTWETETGLFNDEKSIDVGQLGDGYKCSVVMGRTVYIGNVKRTNFNGEVIQEADAIYKSIPDQPDTFPASWRIDAAVNDGEGITALHKWGKDLLQFKHRTLYVIDTSGETEVLKETYKKAGARNSAIVTETPFGVVWANEWGLWLYDGKLNNLLAQDTLGTEEVTSPSGQIVSIKQSTWSTFINSNSILGYYPYKQQIIILDSCDTSENTCAGNIYIYDFRTQSMVRGLGKFTAAVDHTNFITDSNDDLVIAHTTGTIAKWSDSSVAATAQELVLPEFGQLGKKMRVDKISLTYRSSAAQTTPIYYRTDGGGTWTAFGTESITASGNGSTGTWFRKVFDVSPYVECETFQAKVDLPSSGIFTINDVVVSVRPLTAAWVI